MPAPRLDVSEALFSSWSAAGRIVLVGVLAYLIVIASLRLSGKRTLAKMNAFDLVVTVALGSALASTLLSRSVSLADGVVALALLIALQFAVAWVSLRSRRVRQLVKSAPSLLVRDGTLLEATMRRERVDRDEVLAAIRGKGILAMSDVAAVVLETDGSFSVLPRNPEARGPSSLADVPGATDHQAPYRAGAPPPRRAP